MSVRKSIPRVTPAVAERRPGAGARQGRGSVAERRKGAVLRGPVRRREPSADEAQS
ncbi:hypothetical protein [Nocardia gamkensis]|uniref:Uncharacterized protein n=1 Tax=Nocardia gamkensis TaxID=352869 RepID=A0A7X6L3P7_9NOCA|nr:hypothetical protein [Nocardia gamkensis]NKY27198.1 hypothetical protein [Nocardia gamkensis]NQE65723.1 hypothetical protein [Nocardia gamkensis]